MATSITTPYNIPSLYSMQDWYGYNNNNEADNVSIP